MAIDRFALVKRHNPELHAFDPYSVLTVGNGEFAFTADITGLQSFPLACENVIPLCTMAHWGWHSAPRSLSPDSKAAASRETAAEQANRAARANRQGAYKVFDENGLGLNPHFNGERDLYYASNSKGQEELFNWLRQNPHRLHLGRLGFDIAHPELIRNPKQTLDLWTGHLKSEFEYERSRVSVETFCHPQRDILYFSVEEKTASDQRSGAADREESNLTARPGDEILPGLVIAFPYGSHEKSAADWDYRGPNHTVTLASDDDDESHFVFERQIDGELFFVNFEARSTRPRAVRAEARTAEPVANDAVFTITARGHNSWAVNFRGSGRVECAVAFSKVASERTPGWKVAEGNERDGFPWGAEGVEGQPGQESLPSYIEASAAAKAHWENFWNEGAAVDFSAVSDPRALELERRTVLSQYVLAIQCAGSSPPAETGLTFNSWYGKFHLEMHFWHGAQWVLWGRKSLFEKSLCYYQSILDSARERARFQGFRGARWPKMTDPHGRDSPSHIGPFLIWQQPHPIYYAELLYRAADDASVRSGTSGGSRNREAGAIAAAGAEQKNLLDSYLGIVIETAEFMASYARFDSVSNRYVLGPALIPAQENHAPAEVLNPALELAYWRFGLETAQLWCERLGQLRNPQWQHVIDKLSPLPQKDGYYLSHENCPDSYGLFAKDHPEMLAAFAMLPRATMDRAGIDFAAMRQSFERVLRDWDMESLWGWDFPLMAMTAARLGDGQAAVDALLMDTPKNTYLANGHNKQGAEPALPIYLPGNGATLLAVAMMAAGWEGSGSSPNPGFPKDWDVKWEGLSCML